MPVRNQSVNLTIGFDDVSKFIFNTDKQISYPPANPAWFLPASTKNHLQYSEMGIVVRTVACPDCYVKFSNT